MPSDPPLILGFDTSGAHCAAALLSGAEIVAVAAEDMARGQAERVMVLLEETLGKGGAAWADLTAIGVGTGPGNFTGIRISISAARGLALGLGIPAVGVSGFEARAFGMSLPASALISAPRDQVYRQDFSKHGASPPLVQSEETALSEVFDHGYALAPQIPPAKLAENIAFIACESWQTTTLAPAPQYVRAADAAPPRDAPPVLLDE
ncbi:MAG: tRNA (adenosine(37)-N6)-threonylcarbamoyltransferase complex dimerization subunit type 1 TsaB [Paracoccaceae bacterium]